MSYTLGNGKITPSPPPPKKKGKKMGGGGVRSDDLWEHTYNLE